MRCEYWAQGRRGWREYGPYEVTDPQQAVDEYEAQTGQPPVPGDRVVSHDRVWELNRLGQLESVASGPAGEGYVGAMEDHEFDMFNGGRR